MIYPPGLTEGAPWLGLSVVDRRGAIWDNVLGRTCVAPRLRRRGGALVIPCFDRSVARRNLSNCPCDLQIVWMPRLNKEIDRRVKGLFSWSQVRAARAHKDQSSRSEVPVQNEGSLFVRQVQIQ